MFRKVTDLGLKIRYTEDSKFRQHCKMLISSSFLPPSDVEWGYKELENSMDDEEFDQVLDYFEDNYIGRVVRNKKHPRFSIDHWNCHKRFRTGEPRTKNVQKVSIAFLATLLWTLSTPLYTNF